MTLDQMITWTVAWLAVFAVVWPKYVRRRATRRLERNEPESRTRDLADRARRIRDRSAWISRTVALEAELDIQPRSDYDEEVAALSAELDAIAAQIDALTPPAMLPPSRRADPVGPVADVDVSDADTVFGCKIDHATGTVFVPDGAVVKVQALLDARRIRLRAVTQQHLRERIVSVDGSLTQQQADELKALWTATRTARPNRWTVGEHGPEAVPNFVAPPMALSAFPAYTCTCDQHKGRGIPDCPLHRLS